VARTNSPQKRSSIPALRPVIGKGVDQWSPCRPIALCDIGPHRLAASRGPAINHSPVDVVDTPWVQQAGRNGETRCVARRPRLGQLCERIMASNARIPKPSHVRLPALVSLSTRPTPLGDSPRLRSCRLTCPEALSRGMVRLGAAPVIDPLSVALRWVQDLRLQTGLTTIAAIKSRFRLQFGHLTDDPA